MYIRVSTRQAFREVVKQLHGQGCKQIITSQFVFSSVEWHDMVEPLHLSSLPEPCARALLRGGGLTLTDEEASAIVRVCRCNAKVLRIMRGILTAGRCTPKVRAYGPSKSRVLCSAPAAAKHNLPLTL